jgi:hypothetical protein
MTGLTEQELARIASETAMRAAAKYLAQRSLQAEGSVLCECIRAWVRIKLPEAFADAKRALEVGMGEAAQATFLASMAQAGIEAAKEVGEPKPVKRPIAVQNGGLTYWARA